MERVTRLELEERLVVLCAQSPSPIYGAYLKKNYSLPTIVARYHGLYEELSSRAQSGRVA